MKSYMDMDMDKDTEADTDWDICWMVLQNKEINKIFIHTVYLRVPLGMEYMKDFRTRKNTKLRIHFSISLQEFRVISRNFSIFHVRYGK
jgi:hypothetical protein